MRVPVKHLMALLCCGVLPACAQKVDHLLVTPVDHVFASLGEQLQYEVIAQTASNKVVASGAVSWTTSDAQVVTVNESGLVRAVGFGKATITAHRGELSVRVPVEVKSPPPPPPEPSLEPIAADAAWRITHAQSGGHNHKPFYTFTLDSTGAATWEIKSENVLTSSCHFVADAPELSAITTALESLPSESWVVKAGGGPDGPRGPSRRDDFDSYCPGCRPSVDIWARRDGAPVPLAVAPPPEVWTPFEKIMSSRIPSTCRPRN